MCALQNDTSKPTLNFPAAVFFYLSVSSNTIFEF